MSAAERSITLSELDKRLRAHRQKTTESETNRFQRKFFLPTSTMAFASRVLNDLVAALLIGVAFGAAFDAAFNSWPWGCVTLFLLGSVAAVRNVYQTANKMADVDASQSGTLFQKRG